MLDLGCGGGDVITHLARRAERDGLEAEWVGVDPDPRAIEVAAARAALRASVRFRCTDSTRLLADGERFDLVLSNHVLHHLAIEELDALRRRSRADCRAGVVLHGDIERGRIAYALYYVGITPFAPGTFLRTDGLRSIRRSYRARRARRRARRSAWRVDSPCAFRVLATADGTADD